MLPGRYCNDHNDAVGRDEDEDDEREAWHVFGEAFFNGFLQPSQDLILALLNDLIAHLLCSKFIYSISSTCSVSENKKSSFFQSIFDCAKDIARNGPLGFFKVKI